MTFFDTSEQQCKDAFIKAGFWPNEVMWSAWEKAWKLGADAKSEELRKQEPFGNLFPHNGPYNGFCISAPIESLKNAPYGMKLYAAPIPPDNHDWKAEYLRQVDLHNQTLDELREAEMQLRNPAPTPPTPTPIQQEALSEAMRILYKAYRGEAWSMDYQKLLTTQRG